MPDLFGLPMTPENVAARTGRADQVAGARALVFDDGPARGSRGIDVWTGSGLTFTVLPDRGLDIGPASFNGAALAWQSSTGFARPERYEPAGFGWLRTFGGGLLTTCGLRHFGGPDADESGESWGLHGRASHLAAEDVAVERRWEGGQYVLRLRGRMVEAEVFKPAVVLEREITTALGSREIRIADRLTNAGSEPTTAMLLYHINLGWPLLAEASRLWVSAASIKGVTDRAESHVGEHAAMLPPTAGFQEHTYSLVPNAGPDGLCTAALANPALAGGTALSVTWSKAEMPFLAQWKMMGQGVYVLGIEPCTCPFPPRADLRKRGLMPMLEPGQSVAAGVTIRVHTGADELAALERRIRS